MCDIKRVVSVSVTDAIGGDGMACPDNHTRQTADRSRGHRIALRVAALQLARCYPGSRSVACSSPTTALHGVSLRLAYLLVGWFRPAVRARRGCLPSGDCLSAWRREHCASPCYPITWRVDFDTAAFDNRRTVFDLLMAQGGVRRHIDLLDAC